MSISPALQFSIISLLSTALLVGSWEAQASLEDHISKSFNVTPGGNLNVDVDRGSIEVRPVEGNTVAVEVIRRADDFRRSRAEETLRRQQVELTQQGNDVRVYSRSQRQTRWFWFWRGDRLSVRYVISVPKRYHADLKTSGGSITVADLEGTVKVRTSGGSLRLGKINGPVWGRTSGGSITLDGCRQTADVETSGGSLNIGDVEGAVTARTSGGSIRIKQAKGDVAARTSGGSINVDDVFGKIDASTSGGSVTARLARQPEGDCRLRTSGGSITVRMAETIALNIDARTSGGRVSTDLPVTLTGELKKTSLNAKLNGGGPALILHTSGGNVRIQKL